MNLINYLKRLTKPCGRLSLLLKLKEDVNILDVGCGNESVYKVKKILPNCIYHGVDVTKPTFEELKKIDKFHLSNSKNFSNTIKRIKVKYDCVISNHNLEHCYDWHDTFHSIVNKVKENGYIYLAFPSKESITFPSRRGTLNFYDDPTHINQIDPIHIINTLKYKKFELLIFKKNYKPFIIFLIGLILEPFSRLFKKVLFGTWEFYGFETIIIARKIK